MSDTTTTFDAALKEYYTKDVIQELLFRDNPLYKLVKKVEDGTGKDYYRTPLIIGLGGAAGSDFGKVQTASRATPTAVKEFKVTRVNSYGINSVDDVLMLASQGSAASFVEASKTVVEGAVYKLGRDLAISFYRDGYGTRGKIASGGTSATVTLTAISDVFNFEVGDQLDANTNKGDAAKAYGTSGNPLIITGRDEDAGTLTFGFAVNDATNGIPTIANGDYLYLAGDAKASTLTKPVGLAGWLPNTAPSSASFFGLDRTVDIRKLSGVRVNGSTVAPLEALNNLVIKVANVGGKVSHIFCSFGTWQTIINSLEGKVRILDHKDGVVGFAAVEVITPRGKAMVVPEVNCPDNVMYGLQLDTWKCVSLGTNIYSIGSDLGDGLKLRALETADKWELRYRFTGALVCNAPGYNGVAVLS